MEHNRHEEDAMILENIALNDENTYGNSNVNEPPPHITGTEEAPDVESSRKRSKSEASIEAESRVQAKFEKEDTTDDKSPPLENDQRESTLGAEEQPRKKEGKDDEASDADAMPQCEAPKDVLAAEGDDTLSREIRDLEDRVNYCLQSFDDAPFTIQRIAELLVWPERHYRGAMKFLRAIERVVYVTSTVEDFPPTSTQTKDSADSAENEADDEMGDSSVTIEGVGGSIGGGVTVPPSSLFSFLASQDTPASAAGIVAGESDNVARGVATKAIAAREKQPAMSLTAVVASTLDPHKNGEMTRPQESKDIWAAQRPSVPSERHTMAPVAANPLAVGGSEGIPPLDASDTGILHIASTSSGEGDALRSKISESVDASVPVCIDGPDGSTGTYVAQPVDPLQISVPELTTSEIPSFTDEKKAEKKQHTEDRQ
ncbi:hypothetical protein EV178_005391 [Coemansia sp. RSA 1646]|nr:hypothetical protein EV178_005391 [Coemansia sp. RSA 1646]